ncbi:MAG: type II toxin-antitoxin system RatA family toxin [Betaproteobacteria bacterium]
MTEVTKTVIVAFSPAQMFALVDEVERYPEFLPWCSSSQVILRDEATTQATLMIGYRGLRQGFSTKNLKTPPTEMTMSLVEGPFRHLDGQWRFIDLQGRGCKIEFKIVYEFSNRLLAAVVGPVFDHIADTLVDAFVQRAEKLYESD